MGGSLGIISKAVSSPSDASSHVGECTKLTNGVRTVNPRRGSLHHVVIKVRRPNTTDSYDNEEIKG
jgi:hypothetical protein